MHSIARQEAQSTRAMQLTQAMLRLVLAGRCGIAVYYWYTRCDGVQTGTNPHS